MRLAIAEGKRVPWCPFGTVIVNMKTKEIVSRGRVRGSNPIWHGEMSAIAACPDTDTGFRWDEVCLYTTGESCPMCQSAILWAGMPLVVYGSSMPFLQSQGFGDINIRATAVISASLRAKCTIYGGILEEECNQMFVDAASCLPADLGERATA
jgi:tRNA(Arg) A34 adenosine deaminase TadA